MLILFFFNKRYYILILLAVQCYAWGMSSGLGGVAGRTAVLRSPTGDFHTNITKKENLVAEPFKQERRLMRNLAREGNERQQVEALKKIYTQSTGHSLGKKTAKPAILSLNILN